MTSTKIKIRFKEHQPIRFVDLFCGMGSFHYSFRQFGWECIMACDINPAARSNYQHAYGLEPLGDIWNIDPAHIPIYDILCAGFPCQPFSNAGQHRGFDDERGTLFFQIMKFVNYHQPKVVILENVSALLNHDHGQTFKRITNDLRNANYTIAHQVLTCADYGIPQMRKRLFIVCIHNRLNTTNLTNFFKLDKYRHQVTLSEYLGQSFEKKTAYTIRCGGKKSPIGDKHNWDGYMVDGQEYRLTISDALKLQGFENFKLIGSITDQWKLLGNTIPTIFTKIIAQQLSELIFSP